MGTGFQHAVYGGDRLSVGRPANAVDAARLWGSRSVQNPCPFVGCRMPVPLLGGSLVVPAGRLVVRRCAGALCSVEVVRAVSMEGQGGNPRGSGLARNEHTVEQSESMKTTVNLPNHAPTAPQTSEAHSSANRLDPSGHPVPGLDGLLTALQWRYATKRFDPTRRIPPEVWSALQQALILSPSSYGLQPYRFLVVEDPGIRRELLPHSWEQPQIVEASHLVVFASRTEMTEGDVDALVRRTSETRGVPPATLDGYRSAMVGDLVRGPRSKVAAEWAARQAYIALGTLLAAAPLLGVDACPMEGFSPGEYDRILGLEGSGYRSVVVAALGYRAGDDRYATLPKVRFDERTLVQRR